MGLPQENMVWKPFFTEKTLLPCCWVKQGLSYCLWHCDVYSGLGLSTSFWMMSVSVLHLTVGELGLQMYTNPCIWLFKSCGALTQVTRLVKQVPLPAKPSCWPLPVWTLHKLCRWVPLSSSPSSPFLSYERVPAPEVSLCHPHVCFKCNNVKTQFNFLRHWFKSNVIGNLDCL